MSYTEAAKSFKRIQKQCGVEGYTAHDFRDTCATEWRESRISIGLIARLFGYKKTDVTEQRYVKYRPELFNQIKDKMDVYGINNGTNMKDEVWHQKMQKRKPSSFLRNSRVFRGADGRIRTGDLILTKGDKCLYKYMLIAIRTRVSRAFLSRRKKKSIICVSLEYTRMKCR